MQRVQQRLRRLLPAVWVGVLLCIAFIATPAPFATLASSDAGRVVAHVFAREAYLSLVLSIGLLLLEREAAQERSSRGQGSVFSVEMMLALGALFCTVAGYFALQPMMSEARAGSGVASFAVLHGVSLAFFAAKILLVVVLAWRAQGTRATLA